MAGTRAPPHAMLRFTDVTKWEVPQRLRRGALPSLASCAAWPVLRRPRFVRRRQVDASPRRQWPRDSHLRDRGGRRSRRDPEDAAAGAHRDRHGAPTVQPRGPARTVLTNVLTRYARARKSTARALLNWFPEVVRRRKACALLAEVGLEEEHTVPPRQPPSSASKQQRVARSRARSSSTPSRFAATNRWRASIKLEQPDHHATPTADLWRSAARRSSAACIKSTSRTGVCRSHRRHGRRAGRLRRAPGGPRSRGLSNASTRRRTRPSRAPSRRRRHDHAAPADSAAGARVEAVARGVDPAPAVLGRASWRSCSWPRCCSARPRGTRRSTR